LNVEACLPQFFVIRSGQAGYFFIEHSAIGHIQKRRYRLLLAHSGPIGPFLRYRRKTSAAAIILEPIDSFEPSMPKVWKYPKAYRR
jgi:hypothetical protein